MFDDMMNGIREEVLKTFMGIYEAEFKPADKFVVEILSCPRTLDLARSVMQMLMVVQQ